MPLPLRGKLPRLNEPGGLPKIVLGIIGVWGLLAGLMLVHTLLATKQLHGRVRAITASVSDIEKETASIELMRATNRISSELLAASQPLPATLEELKGVTGSLAGKVDSILAGSTTIENNSKAIEGTVIAARDTAADINGSVRGIGRSVGSILATLRATQKAAGEINGSTRGINAAVAALLPVTRDIDAGIGNSNKGIGEAAEVVATLRADIGNILATLPDITRHANSIDCSSGLSVLSLLSGPGAACSP
jgi:ABC-type transporter Mla subunit MlaD